jgi:hypothetical protein
VSSRPHNGGKRIFPGLINPDDTDGWALRQVDLVATIHPPIEGVTVYFRVWRVDDPFDQIHYAMPDVHLIDDDPEGRDNRPQDATDPAVGTYLALTDAAGEARVTVQVSMQPGNNYRAGASILDDAIYQGTQEKADALNNKPTVGSWWGYSAPLDWSPMLTVWRRLHVELDSMGPGTDVSYTGEVREINAEEGHPGHWNYELEVPDINEDGHFEGGALVVPSIGSPYVIADNIDDSY